MKIVTVKQIQQAERDCAKFAISLDMLMENAGKAVAEETQAILGDLKKQNLLVLVGPGNNGGDGLVAARHLYDWGIARVKVYLCGKRPDNDLNLGEIKRRSIHYREADQDPTFSKFGEWLAEATGVLDAVFGTGTIRPLSGTFARLLSGVSNEKSRRPALHVIALDLPSGLNADSGAVDPATPFADNTITLGFPKVGLYNLPGAERAGKIKVVDIGIPAQLVDSVTTELLNDNWARSVLPRRPLVSHKGTYGKIMALVGSINYPGAAYLACSGAIRVGAGLVTLAIAKSLQPMLTARLAEATYLPLPESEPGSASLASLDLLCRELPLYDILLAGCGIGQSPSTKSLLEKLLLDPQRKPPTVVLDADALNILAQIPDWWRRFPHPAIITPHVGEMSRLIQKPVEEIQHARIETAREAAVKWQKTLVLKGAYTVIASPDGRVSVSPFANPGLSSAGTGDVLAGAIAGMAAQGLSLPDAAACGVYLQGLAGEMVKAELGDAGMLASDLLPALPKAIRQLKAV
jgi:hydroxyethylthiazole kinase-like uncharacterized protein yjeF